MINLEATQASRLAGAARKSAREPERWEHFLSPGAPPQELAKARELWAGESGEGKEILRTLCSPEPAKLLELYAWLKRESIKAPIDEAWIAIVCDMGQGEEADRAARGIELTASRFLLLPTEIKTHFY